MKNALIFIITIIFIVEILIILPFQDLIEMKYLTSES